MKKSVILFAMLSAAAAFVSCDQNSVVNAREEVAMDSIHDSSDSVSVPIDTTVHIPVDTGSYVPRADTIAMSDSLYATAGDELIFTPMTNDSSNLGLTISIKTTKSYPVNSNMRLPEFYAFDGKKLKLTIPEFLGPLNSEIGGDKRIITSITYMHMTSEGSTDFEVLFNNKSYIGKVTITGKTYVFNWPYTAGIKFSKLALTK